MNRPFLWSDNVTAEAYDRQVNNNPEYVIKKLHDDIAKLKEQVVVKVGACRSLTESCKRRGNRIKELESALTEAHENIGFLASHLLGRIGDEARFNMARLADEWKELVESGGEL